MRSEQPVTSLLHPAYGSAARDIRAAVGASTTARLDRALRQLDGVRRAIVLRDRHFRGIVIQQTGTYLGTRITPDHQQFVGIDSPDGSILIEQGADTHELSLGVDCDACPPDIDDLRSQILNEATLNAICDWCNSGTPPPWPV